MGEKGKEYAIVKNFLEKCFIASQRKNDSSLLCRVSRALIAFESDVEKDIFVENVVQDYLSN